MGKVTVYYLAHTGRGAFRGSAFRKAFKGAGVIDIEAYARMPAEVVKEVNEISRGDKAAFESRLQRIRESYAKTKNPDLLYDLDILRLVYNSGKRVEFENPPKSPQRYYPYIYGLFPGLLGRKRELKRLALGYPGQEGRFEEEHRVLARSMHDGRRLAVIMKKDPEQKRLVIRGMKHYPTTLFLKQVLERRGISADVEEIVMPYARTSTEGTPYQAPPRLVSTMRVRAGRGMNELQAAREDADIRIANLLLAEGWRMPDALSQAAFVSNSLGMDALKRIASQPWDIRRILRESTGTDMSKPWWHLRKKVRP